MRTQAVVVRTAAWEVKRGGSIPTAAAITTATTVRASVIGGCMQLSEVGNRTTSPSIVGANGCSTSYSKVNEVTLRLCRATLRPRV